MIKRISLLLAVMLSTALVDARHPGAPGGGGQGPGGGPPAAVVDPNTVAPGELLVEPPTLINLGFEWFVEGDDNRNASVAVSYRRSGETAWKEALPLRRLK